MDLQCGVNVLAISNIVLSAVVAVVAGYIAWRQWQTAREKLRLDLFDRRYVLYDSLQNMVTEALNENGESLAALGKYLNALAPARFLMDAKGIDRYVSQLYEKLGKLFELRREKHVANGPTPEIDRQLTEIEAWLRAQRDVIVALFTPHLQIIA
jgi:hypothetical protein